MPYNQYFNICFRQQRNNYMALNYNKLWKMMIDKNGERKCTKIKKVCKRLNKKVKVHIQFNSGMNRCGTNSIDEVVHMCKYAKYSKCIYVDGIYSHFGKPENKKSLKTQVDNFLLAINATIVYNKNIKTHISASGGVIKNQHFNMVRVGLLLYGYKPFDSNLNVKPAMKIEVSVVKNITLKPFSHALYGLKRNYIKKDLILIRFGYGDGIFRKKVKGQFSVLLSGIS